MNLAIPLLALAMTTGEMNEYRGVPAHCVCEAHEYDAWMYVRELTDRRQWWFEAIGGWAAEQRGDALAIAIAEAEALHCFWLKLSYATMDHGSFYYCLGWGDELTSDLAQHINAVREARAMHDWRLYGLPPAIPYWQLPFRSWSDK